MTTITIPEKLTKGGLVIIPRKEYERVLRLARGKGYTKFDRQLDKIIKEVRQGKIEGPFSSVKFLRSSLEK